jgi:N-acyl-D-amino-acid deacylase
VNPNPEPELSSHITRREFLASSAIALAGLGMAAPAIHLPGSKQYDVVIRGGTVFDGTGATGIEADVAILDGRIVSIAPHITDDARLVVDAHGLAVTPGFIDTHSHADGTLFEDPRVESVIREGITTVVVGQDGFSRAPAKTQDGDTYTTFNDFFKAVDALPSAANLASMIGFGTVRELVIGNEDRHATADELRRMVALVEDALTAGACGGSTGLEYIPGAFAPTEELVALSRPLAARGLPYATHMRNEDDHLLDSIEESMKVARGAGCPLHISHIKTMGARNWPKIDTVFQRIADARKAGLDVTFDRYPYLAGATGLSILFPAWSKEGGSDAFLARLKDPALIPRIRKETLAKVDLIGGWDKIMISSVANDDDRAAEGKRLDAIAAMHGQDPYDATVGLLQRNHDAVGLVEFMMSEENCKRFLAHPQAMVCSDGGAVALDGPAHSGHPHPRSLGTFPRVLGHYVREQHVLTFENAIHKMTGFSAATMKLKDRGQLAAGYAADVVVLDPATVIDRATYANPFQYPDGIKTVLVNGAPAWMDGTRSPTHTGRVLRPA